MMLLADLEPEIGRIVRSTWSTRNGTAVPDDSSVTLSNDGVEIDATMLYADLADSTDMMNYYNSKFSAGAYKAFLHCSAKTTRSEGGEITEYDGDRIMAVYIGDSKNTSAVRTSMKIARAVRNIVQSAF